MANTTNYYFNKPTVGGSQNSWGGDLNENWDKIDKLLHGATFTDTDSNTVMATRNIADDGVIVYRGLLLELDPMPSKGDRFSVNGNIATQEATLKF